MEGVIVFIVDTPEVSVSEDATAGDVLLSFYRALGWNGEDALDPCKILTTSDVYNHLYDTIYEKHPDPVGVGMLMVNRGPGTDSGVPIGKVCLLEGWITPVGPEEGDEING